MKSEGCALIIPALLPLHVSTHLRAMKKTKERSNNKKFLLRQDSPPKTITFTRCQGPSSPIAVFRLPNRKRKVTRVIGGTSRNSNSRTKTTKLVPL